MNSALIKQAQALSDEVKTISAEKTASLEGKLKRRSEFYRWVREQEIAIHQLKYQFSQEIAKLHQEATRINQEMRGEIERLRCQELALFLQKEIPGVKELESPCSSPENPSRESRPAELPRQPLAELYVSLSTYTAPIK